MRYKRQVWEYFIKFKDEERVMTYRREKGRENVRAFYDMEDERFYRLLNTFKWLTAYVYPHIKLETPPEKPTNEAILEGMALMKTNGGSLLAYAKKHPKGNLRTSLIKMAKKNLECVDYYTQLVQEDFFANL